MAADTLLHANRLIPIAAAASFSCLHRKPPSRRLSAHQPASRAPPTSSRDYPLSAEPFRARNGPPEAENGRAPASSATRLRPLASCSQQLLFLSSKIPKLYIYSSATQIQK
ncbi:hypothetical protein U9M48_040464, partial [Paspalum notatum var. saurae]